MTLVASSGAWADRANKFEELKENAEPVSNLAVFLDSYLGDCTSELAGGGDCIRLAKQFRSGAGSKKFYMIITEESASMLSFGGVNPSNNQVTINLTPFFPASKFALTMNAPTKTDANGNPVLPYFPIFGTVPESLNASMIGRLVNSRQLRVQVIFTPTGEWVLPKKGGGKIRGVKAKFEAIKVTFGRTGDDIAEWYNRR